MSGGEKQKIACGSAAAIDPDVYVLDEPSSNLDAYAIADFRQLLFTLKSQGKALREKRLAALKAILNAKQYRRIWLYLAEKKSITEIARLEGVTKASVSLSLARAIKKISEKFAAGLKNS